MHAVWAATSSLSLAVGPLLKYSAAKGTVQGRSIWYDDISTKEDGCHAIQSTMLEER